MASGTMIGISVILILVVGPLLLGLRGMFWARRTTASASARNPTPWNWKLTVISTLLYTLAFNLTFFIQELFLVVPKAFTPGLRPTLFHNDHRWEGTNPLANLFQGTGILATLLTGAFCALLLRRRWGGSVALRLFIFWMAYCGLFMALPQVVIGAISNRSDVGMAMAYLDLGTATRTIAALVALAVIPLIALWMRYPLLDLADDVGHIASAKARSFFIFKVATLPSLIAVPLIIPFRMPREWVEVVMIPVVVTVIGMVWIQAGAWRIDNVRSGSGSTVGSIAWPLAAVLLLLLIFQLLLRPGIRFY